MTAEDVEPKPRSGLDRAALYGGLALLYFATRLIFLARGDINVAQALARDASPTTLALSSLLTAVGPALIVVGLLIAKYAVGVHPEMREVAGIILIVGGAGLLPIWLAVALVVAVIMYASLRHVRAATNRVARWIFPKQDRWNGLVWLVISFAFVTAPPAAMPEEEVQMRDGRKITAYVLQEHNGFVPLLQSDSRVVTLVVPEDIEERRLCRGKRKSWYETPLWFHMFDDHPHGDAVSCATDG